MRILEEFATELDSRVRFDENIVMKKNRYFLVHERLKPLIQNDFYHAGAYLGKVKNRVFFPSFILLKMIAAEKANKTTVDDKTAWLFICGRDIFGRGILSVAGSRKKGHYTLILNRHNECLGFGKMLHDIDTRKKQDSAIVKNISDIGDFLRRE